LSKARRSCIKDIILGKVTIAKTNEEISEKTDEGKSMLKVSNLNEIPYKELFYPSMQGLVVVKWGSTWLKAARTKIIHSAMQLLFLGKD
jgi:hypothetical protein